MYRFGDFWSLYDKKIDRPKCEKKWKLLTQKDRDDILAYVPAYVKSTPDKQYRKHPATFLNNRAWENELVEKSWSNTDAKESALTGRIDNDWLWGKLGAKFQGEKRQEVYDKLKGKITSREEYERVIKEEKL